MSLPNEECVDCCCPIDNDEYDDASVARHHQQNPLQIQRAEQRDQQQQQQQQQEQQCQELDHKPSHQNNLKHQKLQEQQEQYHHHQQETINNNNETNQMSTKRIEIPNKQDNDDGGGGGIAIFTYQMDALVESDCEHFKQQQQQQQQQQREQQNQLHKNHKHQNKHRKQTTTTRNLFDLIYRMLGEKEQRTREMGTLILLLIMFLFFVISLMGCFVMWFTEYYNNTMLSNLILSENSESAEKWMNPSSKYDTLLKVHIFNYTNIEDFLEGKADKIKIKDLGPLTYKEHTTRVNVVFNANHTVTFREHRSYQFLREKSSCNEDDRLFVPNVPLIAADYLIEQMSGLQKFSTSLLLKGMREPPFKSLTAHEFLWGYYDHISALNFASGNAKFGLLMNRNGTSVDSLQINTGEEDLHKFSLITQFNGMPLLNFWSDRECNRIDGSDASMFPPHLVQARATLHVFLQVLCRKIPLHYDRDVNIFNDIAAVRYRTPLNAFSNPQENSENRCYCLNTERCLPSGIVNATKCYNGAPIYPSFPHFLAADSKLYELFDGIAPKQDLHQTYADLHPRFGFPISGASRMQINIAVHKGAVLQNQLRRLPKNTILPLIWIEITSGDFTDDIIETLYASTYGLNFIQYTLKYGTLLMCLLLFGLLMVGLYYLSHKFNQQQQHQQQQQHPQQQQQQDQLQQQQQSQLNDKSLKGELLPLNRLNISNGNLNQI